MTDSPKWHITGEWFDNCSCAVACPCTFAQPPDNGFCESVLFWHVQRGRYGDVNLDGLSFVRVGPMGSGDRRQSEGLGQGPDRAHQPAGKVSTTHERARLRDRSRPTAR